MTRFWQVFDLLIGGYRGVMTAIIASNVIVASLMIFGHPVVQARCGL